MLVIQWKKTLQGSLCCQKSRRPFITPCYHINQCSVFLQLQAITTRDLYNQHRHSDKYHNIVGPRSPDSRQQLELALIALNPTHASQSIYLANQAPCFFPKLHLDPSPLALLVSQGRVNIKGFCWHAGQELQHASVHWLGRISRQSILQVNLVQGSIDNVQDLSTRSAIPTPV